MLQEMRLVLQMQLFFLLELNFLYFFLLFLFQLVDALKQQEEINLRLRQYMDKIILAILDHNPSILEIKQ